MLSAAARAISTRSPWSIEPEASSTSVTLSGLSSGSSGAWNASRTSERSLSKGWLIQSLVIAKKRSLDGSIVAVVEGVDPLLRAHRVRVNRVALMPPS